MAQCCMELVGQTRMAKQNQAGRTKHINRTRIDKGNRAQSSQFEF